MGRKKDKRAPTPAEELLHAQRRQLGKEFLSQAASEQRRKMRERLAAYEKQFAAGDGEALAKAMRECAAARYWPTEAAWVNNKIHRGADDWLRYDAKSFDEAIGLKHPKGKRFPDQKKRSSLMPLISKMVLKNYVDAGQAINWADVSEQFDISVNTAKSIYYDKANTAWRQFAERIRRSKKARNRR